MSGFTLTDDQQAAYQNFIGFMTAPDEQIFILAGYAGTGKSTLVERILDDLSSILSSIKLITQKKSEWEVQLTATTNKAAEALENITNREVLTIQSFLGLRVNKNYKTQKTTLVPGPRSKIKENFILFIDEASYIDADLWKWILDRTMNCKIIFIGDPAQLTAVKCRTTPVFEGGTQYRKSELKAVVRQAEGNPIIELASAFRNTVMSNEFFSFKPDGHHIRHAPREEFDQLITAEFQRPDWQHNDSKVLAWTNKTVIGYNQGIRQLVQGAPELQAGDYAICNKYISYKKGDKSCSIKTDQTVRITSINPAIDYNVEGWMVCINDDHEAFFPKNLSDVKTALREAKKAENFKLIQYIETHWIDLRAAYACTINKSQGSTYKKVFIDLDDIKKCHLGDQIARMMYVAVSRASEQVFMTGDLV